MYSSIYFKYSTQSVYLSTRFHINRSIYMSDIKKKKNIIFIYIIQYKIALKLEYITDSKLTWRHTHVSHRKRYNYLHRSTNEANIYLNRYSKFISTRIVFKIKPLTVPPYKKLRITHDILSWHY